MEIKIVHLCPDLLNLFGDKGNIAALEKRCLWRDIKAEVVEIKEEDILPPPSIVIGGDEKVQNKYVYAIGKVGDSVKLLVDPDRILKDEDITVMEQAMEEHAEEKAEEGE